MTTLPDCNQLAQYYCKECQSKRLLLLGVLHKEIWIYCLSCGEISPITLNFEDNEKALKGVK